MTQTQATNNRWCHDFITAPDPPLQEASLLTFVCC